MMTDSKYRLPMKNVHSVIKQGFDLIAEGTRRGYAFAEIEGYKAQTAAMLVRQFRTDAQSWVAHLDGEMAKVEARYSQRPKTGAEAQMREYDLNRLRDRIATMSNQELREFGANLAADPLTAARDEAALVDSAFAARNVEPLDRAEVRQLIHHSPHEFDSEWLEMKSGRDEAARIAEQSKYGTPNSLQVPTGKGLVPYASVREFVDITLRDWTANGVPADVKSSSASGEAAAEHRRLMTDLMGTTMPPTIGE